MDEEEIIYGDLVTTPTKTYKIINGRIAGYTDGLDAMRQAIDKLLNTERFAYLIYSENYGVELEDLIGEQMDLVKSEIERVVTEAIETDDRVISVDNFLIINETIDALTISFDVATVFGNISIEREVAV